MIKNLPLNADEIGFEWPIEEGGIGVTARTDQGGTPLIGLYQLKNTKRGSGRYCEFPRDRIKTGIVAGYTANRKPVKVFIDVALTPRGMEMHVSLPATLRDRGYPTQMFAAWGKDEN
jgi:hypothetical protein